MPIKFDLPPPEEPVEGDMEINIKNTLTEDDSTTQKPYTAYEIEIHEDGKKWTVKRRYRDFHTLHNNLCKVFNSGFLPNLPPKYWFGSLKPEKIKKRKVQLNQYLQEIMSREELYDCRLVREFLEIDQHIMPETPRFSLRPADVIDTAVAVYTYKKTEEDELTFEKGEEVSILKKDESGWWYGVCNGQTGFFPSNFVKVEEGQEDQDNNDNNTDNDTEQNKEQEQEQSPSDKSSDRNSDARGSTDEPGGEGGEQHQQQEEEQQQQESESEEEEEIEPENGVAIHEYTAEEDGEISMKPGDKLLIFGDQEGWSYVEHSNSGEQGYVPSTFIEKAENE